MDARNLPNGLLQTLEFISDNMVGQERLIFVLLREDYYLPEAFTTSLVPPETMRFRFGKTMIPATLSLCSASLQATFARTWAKAQGQVRPWARIPGFGSAHTSPRSAGQQTGEVPVSVRKPTRYGFSMPESALPVRSMFRPIPPPRPKPVSARMQLLCTTELKKKDRTKLGEDLQKAYRLYHAEVGWVTPSCHPFIDPARLLIHRSRAQGHIIYSTRMVTLISIDWTYAFRAAITMYSQELTLSLKSKAMAELRGLMLASELQPYLLADISAPWLSLPYSELAALDIETSYGKVYGNREIAGLLCERVHEPESDRTRPSSMAPGPSCSNCNRLFAGSAGGGTQNVPPVLDDEDESGPYEPRSHFSDDSSVDGGDSDRASSTGPQRPLSFRDNQEELALSMAPPARPGLIDYSHLLSQHVPPPPHLEEDVDNDLGWQHSSSTSGPPAYYGNTAAQTVGGQQHGSAATRPSNLLAFEGPFHRRFRHRRIVVQQAQMVLEHDDGRPPTTVYYSRVFVGNRYHMRSGMPNSIMPVDLGRGVESSTAHVDREDEQPDEDDDHSEYSVAEPVNQLQTSLSPPPASRVSAPPSPSAPTGLRTRRALRVHTMTLPPPPGALQFDDADDEN